MKIKIKAFADLSLHELYYILRLRSEVFVLEQACVYQDMDQKDQKAIHVMGFINDEMIAYARCFGPGNYFERAAIGRVLLTKNYRRNGYGHQLVNAAIKAIEEIFDTDKVEISAQLYLEKFYKSHGFQSFGETYYEDKIPHIRMLKV